MSDEAAVERWALTLYVDGASTSSIRAIEAVRRVCDRNLGGRADLEIIDVHQHPALSRRDQVVVAPTLIKHVPGPPRRIVGELSAAAWLSLGLDLGPRPASARDAGRDV
jgi:circadian clock protein KaiB